MYAWEVPPRRPDAPTRDDLVAAAARMLAADGPSGLTLRRLAESAGTSTMAIYTHFGGMPELRRALRHRGYDALSAALAAAPAGDGPVEHVRALCHAYVAFGLEQRDLYRVMFNEEPLDDEDAAACAATFEPLVAAVAACGYDGDPLALAKELWIAGHGVVALALAGLLDDEEVRAGTRGTLEHLLAAFAARRP
jgi:AcrR family transcriptional regulator